MVDIVPPGGFDAALLRPDVDVPAEISQVAAFVLVRVVIGFFRVGD